MCHGWLTCYNHAVGTTQGGAMASIFDVLAATLVNQQGLMAPTARLTVSQAQAKLLVRVRCSLMNRTPGMRCLSVQPDLAAQSPCTSHSCVHAGEYAGPWKIATVTVQGRRVVRPAQLSIASAHRRQHCRCLQVGSTGWTQAGREDGATRHG